MREHHARHSSLCSSTSNATRGFGSIEVEGGQAERGEVSRSSTSITVPVGSCTRSTGEQQVLPSRVEDGDVPAEAGVDRVELLDRRRHGRHERRITPGLRNAFEPDVALFGEPVERLTLEHDPVVGRCLRERPTGRRRALQVTRAGPAATWRYSPVSTSRANRSTVSQTSTKRL